jgi:hypothetical protein
MTYVLCDTLENQHSRLEYQHEPKQAEELPFPVLSLACFSSLACFCRKSLTWLTKTKHQVFWYVHPFMDVSAGALP